MLIDLLIEAIKAIIVVVMVLNLAGVLLWFERKGSALIQDRIGANRASITGLGQRIGLPNLGFVNTLIADPLKLFTKEDFVPEGADKFLHGLAPFLALFPVIITFAVVPFGDVVKIGSRTITLQAADVSSAALYILATIGIGVYGVALGGWASNNRWALLGGVRATAQMISYEIGLGLAIISVVMTYGTLDLQVMCHAQGGVWFGFLPRWGICLQPIAFLMLLIAGMAESIACRSICPRGNRELVAGYLHRVFRRQAGGLHDDRLCRVLLVSVLITVFFFGGWQCRGFIATASTFPAAFISILFQLLVAILGLVAFMIKTIVFCWWQILIRWTLPRFESRPVDAAGWGRGWFRWLANVVVTAIVIVLASGAH